MCFHQIYSQIETLKSNIEEIYKQPLLNKTVEWLLQHQSNDVQQ